MCLGGTAKAHPHVFVDARTGFIFGTDGQLEALRISWSPKSCKRIWDTARTNGLSVDDTIVVLSEAERKTLSKDKH